MSRSENTLRPIDQWYLRQSEPNRSCLEVMRALIRQHDPGITEAWKYGMPFFCYENRMLCYLWNHKKNGQPYLGIVDGNLFNDDRLLQEKRSRMKILLIDPLADIPVEYITSIIERAIDLRRVR